MKPLVLGASLVLTSLFGVTAHAHGQEPATAQIVDVPIAAKSAVAVVDAFGAALAKADFAEIEAILDPEVVILEAGGAEHSRAEYLGGHAKSDAKFLSGAHTSLVKRIARTQGSLAWVASEHEVHITRDGKPQTLLSAETMVLERNAAGWRVVHIHWSSREKRAS